VKTDQPENQVSYLTVAEFKDRIPADDLASMTRNMTDEERDAEIARCVASAEGQLEGYAEPRYTLPLIADDVVADIVFRLARYQLFRRKGWNMTDADRDDEKNLLKQLAMIPERKFSLPGQTPTGSVDRATSIPATPDARTTGRARAFTRDSMKGF
jgi:phage gp36-like protein